MSIQLPDNEEIGQRSLTLRFLWLWWTLVSASSGAIVGALEAGGFEFFATLVLTGFVVGIAQWWVLRGYIQSAIWWVLASALGWFVGINLAIVSGGLFNALIELLFAVGELGEVFWLNVVKQPVILAVFGVAQWLVLRRHVQAGWWVLASAVGGVVQGVVSTIICAAACQALTVSVGEQIATAVTYAAGWAGYGAVTGIVLAWLLHSQQKAQISP